MSLQVNIKKRLGSFTLESAFAMDGGVLGLLGASGCGKSMTLKCIAGIEKPDEGRIVLDGRVLYDSAAHINLPPQQRHVGYLFQNYALFPNMTVRQNILAGLHHEKDRRKREKAMQDAVHFFQLDGLEARRPNQLSGGQQQRVALARALVVEPGVLLFDEPLSNLDAKLRVQMRTEIRRIQQKLGITAIYVTHDQSEAMSISDRIIIMQKGVIAQIGTPMEIYYHPVNEFVADFIGEANFLKGTVADSTPTETHVTIGNATVVVASDKDAVRGQECEIVLRPEAIQLGDTGMLPGKVELSCFMGSYQNYHVRVGDTLVKIADNCPVAKKIYAVGDDVWLSFDKECAHIL